MDTDYEEYLDLRIDHYEEGEFNGRPSGATHIWSLIRVMVRRVEEEEAKKKEKERRRLLFFRALNVKTSLSNLVKM